MMRENFPHAPTGPVGKLQYLSGFHNEFGRLGDNPTLAHAMLNVNQAAMPTETNPVRGGAMNDESQSAESRPELAPCIETAPSGVPQPPRTIGYWLKRLFVCNPFYLASAALLLYGLYRVSVDPNAFATELSQLTFNFASLQFYELSLAGTAMVLVTRRIWYDATLLVVLENLLVLVPFILVSQAALLEQKNAWIFCLLAAALAVGRTGWLRQRAGPLMPAGRALFCGLVVLAVNTALPLVYRHNQETKAGINITSGAAYEMNEASWFWLLPALALLANLLPRPEDNPRETQVRRWFTMALFLFWLVGTGVHLYCLGYVYDFKLRREQLAPVLWVLAWTMRSRLTDFVALPPELLRKTVLVLPLLATLVSAFAADSHVFLILSALNFLGFAVVLVLERSNLLALQLALLSIASTVSALPVEILHPIATGFDQTKLIGIAALAYLVISTALSRNPKLAILGALAAAMAGGMVREGQSHMLYWVAQAGLVYFLLHSLRWRDYEHPGAAGVRIFIAALWVLHTFVWVHNGAAWSQPLIAAGLVLFVWWGRGFVFRMWRPQVIPIAALLVALCNPVHFVALKTQTTPMGVIAVIGSFALFAAGTAAALTKHRWHKN
jgi:hypothetical protein